MDTGRDIKKERPKEKNETLTEQKQKRVECKPITSPAMNKKRVKTEQDAAIKSLNKQGKQSNSDEARSGCRGGRRKTGNEKIKTLRFTSNLKSIILFILLVLRILNIRQTSASETKNIWLYKDPSMSSGVIPACII